jgi:glycosyltransferase involved in cell wall biosynthesis
MNGRADRPLPAEVRLTSPPLRVLVNAVHAKSGGGVTYLRNLLPLLAAEPGLDVHLAVQAGQRDLALEVAGGRPLHLLPDRGALYTVLVQEQTDIPALARRIGAGVVFSPANFGPLRGCAGVILLRNAFAVGALERRLSKRLYWAAVRVLSWLSFLACRRAIVVSAHAGGQFLKAFGRPGDPRLEVVHHGVGGLFHPPADDAGRDRRRLLAVSDIYIQKNLETAIAAMARLPADVVLDVAGRVLDPEYFARLQALCVELKVVDRVRFLGGLPAAEVAEAYRRAGVFVFPSLVETFGNPVLEAMASGLPVVCADAAAMPEVAGAAALYARPADADDLAAQIRRLLDDGALWSELSRRGVARAADFTWERTAAATARVLREAAGVSRTGA